MSSNEFAATIELAPRPSIGVLKWLFALHVVPAVAVIFAMQPGTPMVLLAAAIGVSWFYVRRHPALGFAPKGLTRLTWHAEGEWTLEDAAGRKARARLKGNSYVHPRLLVLNFALEGGGTRTRILMDDDLSPELARRLRARLEQAA